MATKNAKNVLHIKAYVLVFSDALEPHIAISPSRLDTAGQAAPSRCQGVSNWGWLKQIIRLITGLIINYEQSLVTSNVFTCAIPRQNASLLAEQWLWNRLEDEERLNLSSLFMILIFVGITFCGQSFKLSFYAGSHDPVTVLNE